MKTIVAVSFAILLGGCASRTHLTAGHGRSYRAAIERQAQNPEAGKQPVAAKGLDSQEAAVIAQSYRQHLTPKGQAVEAPPPMLLVAPSALKGRQGDYMPAASVPPER
ncbi:MAG: hypothetical protein JXP73_12370 [Deltaproteobacteria bacterium]|nr:hypothetical protein [Deltaproteobacteria bacterium]